MNKRLNKIYLLIIFLLLSFDRTVGRLPQLGESFNFTSSDRETRAVWVATNHRLDWPPHTFNSDEQKKSLDSIFSNIKTKNLNTVYFQVRSNGTVLFKSSFDPISPYITGNVNDSTSFDPLHYAVRLAHKKGLEIHAWINCLNVFSGNETNILNNFNHISQRKPDWIIKDTRDGTTSYWLDPGLPEVREYVTDLILEMVENYNVDGVHLDYIRYAGKNIDDDFSYGIYGSGMDLDDWRRKNITDLITLINQKIKAVKPYVKLGATPIGVFKNQNGMYAMQGYSDVYQDSRTWLKEGIVDYVTPQIYWGIKDTPRFDVIAKDWVENSFGRNIVLGIGAYKSNVKSEINQLIQYSRTIGASGIAFFRYSSIEDFDFKNFSYKTFPSAMTWLDGMNPTAPINLKLKTDSVNPKYITLTWENDNRQSEENISYYALYNLPDENSQISPDDLFDVIPSGKTSVTLFVQPKKINYYFALKSVNKLWNESKKSSNIVNVKFKDLEVLVNNAEVNVNPVLLKEANGRFKILLFSDKDDNIVVYGRNQNNQNEILSTKIYTGKNIIDLSADISNYKTVKIKFGSSKKETELTL